MTGALAEKQKSAGRILVVDDDDAGRYAKSRILRQAGYHVVEAATGGEAFERVRHDQPDLVLLDVRLPDINGFEVCRRIKRDPATAALPVLQISASYRDDQSKVTGLECGADAYMTEPVEGSVLVATIAAFLRTRRAERAVREHAVEWQTTFDAITDGVALVDAEGKIVRSNRSLSSLLNVPADQLRGAAFDELLPPRADDRLLWRKPERGEPDTGARRHAERSLAGRIFALAIDPVWNDHHDLSGWVCIISDVTQTRLLNERLWHTQKLESIGLLAGGVAHDFNNLLMGVLGNACLGLEALYDPRLTEKAFRDITRAAERAADLTRQLLAYAGKGRFVIQTFDLSQAITGLLPLAKASFGSRVELVLQLADHLPPIKADKTQIEQVIMNLLMNAAEAIGDDEGTVTIRTRALFLPDDQRHRYLSEAELRGHFVLLEVRDTGMGMDEHTARHAFDPFFTTKFMGRGLGLSAALGIVRGHQGGIRVTSAPGKGAAFELLFPAAEEAGLSRPKPAAVESARHTGRGTILVIDDEEVVRTFLQTALQRHGYEVVLAADGAEGVRIFSESPQRFSLVVLDLVMPAMTGKEALPRLLAARPDIQVLLTSGQVQEEVRRELGNAGIGGFIQKPCAVQPLIAKIESLSRR